MILVCTFALSSNAYSQDIHLKSEKSNIKYIESPESISEEQVSLSDLDLKSRELQETDLIIINTKNGKPILPDYKQAIEEPAIYPANEINFTFDSPDYPWTATELESLQTWVDDFYPMVKLIYGSPAFSITVNIRKDPNIAFSGTYNPSTNEITLRSAKEDVLCHEMIHSFHDDNIVLLSSYEEGMTRAAEVEVFNQLDDYYHWNENHSYYVDTYYEHDNQPDIGGENGSFGSGFVNVLLQYQQAGYVWAKAFLEDKDFFVNFNQAFYAQALVDPSVGNDESKLKDILRTVKPTVEGEDFDTWYAKQHILNTHHTSGYKLIMKADSSTVYYFYRSDTGLDTMQTGETLSWSVYDYDNILIDSGSKATSDYGWIDIYPEMPSGYRGRIKIVVTADTPEGEISRAFFNSYGVDETGVFGIVKNQTEGEIVITPLNDPSLQESTEVINGAFSIPSLRNIRGQFSLVYTDFNNRQIKRTFTKDASSYYVCTAGDATAMPLLSLGEGCGTSNQTLCGSVYIPINLSNLNGVEIASTCNEIYYD
ncbi:MAG: hypothetical protein KAQ81_08050, partial [Deltaproteobacteria bacterium]|nr:hypothetical protein [Deltaproteobacteria bacterium]